MKRDSYLGSFVREVSTGNGLRLKWLLHTADGDVRREYPCAAVLPTIPNLLDVTIPTQGTCGRFTYDTSSSHWRVFTRRREDDVRVRFQGREGVAWLVVQAAIIPLRLPSLCTYTSEDTARALHASRDIGAYPWCDKRWAVGTEFGIRGFIIWNELYLRGQVPNIRVDMSRFRATGSFPYAGLLVAKSLHQCLTAKELMAALRRCRTDSLTCAYALNLPDRTEQQLKEIIVDGPQAYHSYPPAAALISRGY